MSRVPPAIWAIGLIGAGLGALVGWSMLTETLLPLARQAAYVELALNCLGLPLILFGVAIFVWGGLVFVGRTYELASSAAFADRAIQLRSRATPRAERRAAERAQLRGLWQAWAPGLAWLAAGGGLIGGGSLLINWLPRVLGSNR